ncbi:hypothetical protein EDD17DRAFT_129688 [Pisolithus thermaeus]|nr:hypothetical protein EDD17DRAFT_129688 [Pisolithus thermaeus]
MTHNFFISSSPVSWRLCLALCRYIFSFVLDMISGCSLLSNEDGLKDAADFSARICCNVSSSTAFNVVAGICAHFLAIWSKREYNLRPASLSHNSLCLSTVSFRKRTSCRFLPVSCRSNSPNDPVCFR